MADLSQRLRLLLAGQTPRREAARVLVAALDYAAEDERDALGLAAIDTGRVEALCAVIRRLDRFGSGVVESLANSAALRTAIERVIGEGRPHWTCNAIQTVAESGRTDMLPLLTRLLESSLDDVPDLAGEAFLRIVVSRVGETGRRRANVESALEIDDAVAAALDSYQHHRNRRCVLAAAIVSVRPGPRLAAILDDPASSAALALRSAVRDLDDPLVRRNLLGWLGVDGLSAPVARWLDRLRTAEHFTDFLSRGHLLRESKRRRALRRIDRPKRFPPTATAAAEMDQKSQRWLPDLIAALALPTQCRVEFLHQAAGLSSVLARLRAANDLAALAAMDDSAAGALERFCTDEEPAVARTAALHLLAPPLRPDHALLTRLAESSRPEIARPAQRHLAGRSVRAFFDHWLELSDLHRLAAAHRLIVRDRERLVHHLRERIALSGREERLAAIAIARRLRLTDEIIEPILVQSASADPRIASAAVAALAQARHPQRKQAARVALRHIHPRVRANAVDVIASLDEPMTDLVAPLMTGRDNRVRANAIRAVMECKPDAAEPNLRSMLRDPNPLHRVSALWVVRRGRVWTVLDELESIARSDPLEPVRERAAATKRAMLLENSRW